VSRFHAEMRPKRVCYVRLECALPAFLQKANNDAHGSNAEPTVVSELPHVSYSRP